jgi:ABC-type amino acid transport substrate-binding protein
MNEEKRVQLSLRFDKYKDLLEAVNLRVKQLDCKLTDYVAIALQNALATNLAPGQTLTPQDSKTEALETKIEGLSDQLAKNSQLLAEVDRRLGELKGEVSFPISTKS